MSLHQNLYLPGVLPDGTPRTLVDIPGYWGRTRSDQHRGGPGEAYEVDLSRTLREAHGGMSALVMLDRIDHATGKVLSRTLTHNVETDTVINNMLKLFGSSGAITTLGQYVALDTTTAWAVMSGGTINNASGAQTTIVVAGNTFTGNTLVSGNVAANWAAAASNNGTGQNVTTPGIAGPDAVYGTGINWSYGTSNAEWVSGVNAGSYTSTSLQIASFTVTAGKSHVAGDYVVAYPSTKDGPAAAPGGMFVNATPATPTYTTTAGIGNRKVQLVSTCSSVGGFPSASYSGIWIVSFSTVGTYVSTGTYAHISSTPQVLNATTSVQVTYTATL